MQRAMVKKINQQTCWQIYKSSYKIVITNLADYKAKQKQLDRWLKTNTNRP